MRILLPTPSSTYIGIENRARRKERIDVQHEPNEGTYLVGPKSAFEEIIKEIEEERDQMFQNMADTDRLKTVDENEEKRKDLKHVRIKLQNVIDNPNHDWREPL